MPLQLSVPSPKEFPGIEVTDVSRMASPSTHTYAVDRTSFSKPVSFVLDPLVSLTAGVFKAIGAALERLYEFTMENSISFPGELRLTLVEDDAGVLFDVTVKYESELDEYVLTGIYSN